MDERVYRLLEDQPQARQLGAIFGALDTDQQQLALRFYEAVSAGMAAGYALAGKQEAQPCTV